MTGVIRAWLMVFGVLFLAGRLAGQAVPEADRLAFEAGLRSFEAGLYERAMTELTAVAASSPDPVRRAEAAELAAFARGEFELARGDAAAAATFAAFRESHPQSKRLLAAVVREAMARLRRGEYRLAADLLGAAGGPFERALGTEGSSAEVRAGLRLAAEARLALGEPAAAEALARRARAASNSPAEQWESQRWIVEALEAKGELEAAVEAAVEWLKVSGDPSLAARRPRAVAVLGRLRLEQGRVDEGRAVLAENLADGVPAEFRRDATLRLAEQDLKQGEPARARDRVEGYFRGAAPDPAAGELRRVLGQALFDLYRASNTNGASGPSGPANLSLASAEFATAVTNSPPGRPRGRAQLGLGWCRWEEAMVLGRKEQLAEAAAVFGEAAQELPHSAEQAVARLKLGDIALLREDPGLALTNYLGVAQGYDELPEVQQELVSYAWQQLAVAAVATTNAPLANRAVEELLRRDPGGEPAARTALLVGQAMSRDGYPFRARELLSLFSTRFPGSAVRPEAELAVATSWMRERRWTNALGVLDRWLQVHTNHSLVPRAEFDRAWVVAQAGEATNSVELFASLARRYPTNTLAHTAQLWLGDHFFSQGNFARAEQAYLVAMTNATAGPAGQAKARLLAAEAALRGQRFGNAREHLLSLLNEKETPASLLAPAFFTLGNVFMLEASVSTNSPLLGYQEALESFTRVTQFTNSPLLAAAWGRMGDCHLQLAVTNPVSYERATELYQRVVDAPLAEISLRAKAKVGLGIVDEKVAAGRPPSQAAVLIERALNHYLDVAMGRVLRAGDVADSWWVNEAGNAAGTLLERLQRWREAAGLYDQLAKSLSASRAYWESRRERATGQLAGSATSPPTSL